MVARIGLAVVIVVGILAILYAVPRYLGDDEWPDVANRMEMIADDLVGERPRTLDIGLGVVGVLLLAVGIFLFLNPTMMGGLEPQADGVAFALAILGFFGIFVATFLNSRRAGLYSAEAMLLGMSLVGSVLLLLIVALLIQG